MSDSLRHKERRAPTENPIPSDALSQSHAKKRQEIGLFFPIAVTCVICSAEERRQNLNISYRKGCHK